jgi:hypothetical protein
MKHISSPLQSQPGHWGPITIHYRLIWDCVPSSSPLTIRRELRWRYSNPPPHGAGKGSSVLFKYIHDQCAGSLYLITWAVQSTSVLQFFWKLSLGSPVFNKCGYPSNQSQSHITTDSQSAIPSWCQAPIWDPQPIFPHPLLDYVFRQFLICWCGKPSLTRSRGCTF